MCIETVPVPMEVVDRLRQIAENLVDLGNDISDFVITCQQVHQVVNEKPETKEAPAPTTPDLFSQEPEAVADGTAEAPAGDAQPRHRHVGELGQKRWTPAERESLRRLIATGADDRTIYDTYIINNRPRTYHAVVREIYSQRMTARAIAARNR